MKVVSTSTLDKLHRQAVKLTAGGICRLCGAAGTQVHHIVKRCRVLTRWLIGNGVLLCDACHSKAHTMTGHYAIMATIPMTELETLWMLERQIYKQFLADKGFTNAEYRRGIHLHLRQIIAQYN